MAMITMRTFKVGSKALAGSMKVIQ
jgi:hypothetical protein